MKSDYFCDCFSDGGERRRFFIFLFCLVAVCTAAAYVGAVPTRKFGHDIFFMLDNGWRVINGQRPHLDFTSPWGSLSFLVVGAGMAVSRNSVNSIGYGDAMFALVVALWGYRLSRETMPYLPRLFFCLYLALLVVSPYSLGWGPLNSSHAMYYNRYGYALLGLLMLSAFPPQAPPRREGRMAGVSSGAVAALALFLKANYFGAALLLIVASLLSGRHSRRHIVWLVVGFSLVTLAFLWYLGFDIAALRRDLQMAAGARSNSFSYRELLEKFSMNSVFLLFVALLSFQSGRAMQARGMKNALRATFLSGCFVFAVDLILLCSNQQYFELPLSVMFSLLVIVRVATCYGKRGDGREAMPRAAKLAVAVGAIFFFVSFFTQSLGLAYGLLQKASPSDLKSVARFTEPRLTPLLLYDDPSQPKSNGKDYVAYVNSGVRILRRNSGQADTVLTMDMMNPFPYALGRSEPKGGMAAAAYNYTFSDSHRPSDDTFFGNADVVMVPKQPASPPGMQAGLIRIYRNGLLNRFRLVVENDLWYLYKRK